MKPRWRLLGHHRSLRHPRTRGAVGGRGTSARSGGARSVTAGVPSGPPPTGEPDVARLAQSLLEAAAALIATGDLGRRGAGQASAQRGAITVVNDTDADAPLTVTVEEASRLLGISRAHGYELVARGELPSIRLGRRIVIPRRALVSLARGEEL